MNLEAKMSKSYDEAVKSVEKSSFEVASALEQSKLDSHFVHDCVEDAVMVKFAKDQQSLGLSS